MHKIITCDGIDYHATVEIMDDGFRTLSPVLYADTGEWVPANICVCEASHEEECACGAWERDDFEE